MDKKCYQHKLCLSITVQPQYRPWTLNCREQHLLAMTRIHLTTKHNSFWKLSCFFPGKCEWHSSPQSALAHVASWRLKYFSCRFFLMMRPIDDLGMPVPCDISRTVLWVRCWSSWLRTISFTWSMFSSVRALRGMPLPLHLSTVSMSLNFFSNLLMLLFVHPLSGNSVLNCLALHFFNWYKFFIRILSWSLITMFTKQCSNVWRLGWHYKWLPN